MSIDYSRAHNLKYPQDFKLADGSIKTYWRKLHSSEILRFFEVGGRTGSGAIPADHSDIRKIGDTWVKILTRHNSFHNRRVVAICKHCEAWVCAGHLDQHQRGRWCRLAAESD